MSTNNLKIGFPAPDFILTGIDDKKYSLESFKDKKAVVIIFSCNHCPYVQAYEERIINDYATKAVAVIAINSNEDVNYPDDSFENMKKRAAEKNFNFPYLRDEDQSVARAYDATHTPEIFLLDAERKLAGQGSKPLSAGCT